MSEMGMAMMGTGVSSGESRAREAAEAAIKSPLLEDVNLQGARGILVNITAGMDLSLGEFAEVGDTVEEFASDNATVVVGTVIDPDMTDELKVTVVATGLGDAATETPVRLVNTGRENPAGRPNYGDYDVPPTMRRKSAPVENTRSVRATEEPVSATPAAGTTTAAAAGKNMEMLDIPAFLRRQAN